MRSTTMRRPARRMPTRSATRSTSDRLWLERKTVRPSARTSRMMACSSCCMSGSRPLLGSSRMSSSGSLMKAAMSATFWRLPLERSAFLRERSASSRSARSATTRSSTPPRRLA